MESFVTFSNALGCAGIYEDYRKRMSRSSRKFRSSSDDDFRPSSVQAENPRFEFRSGFTLIAR